MAEGCAEPEGSGNKTNMTSAGPCAGRTESKSDAINLSILILLASAIGIYLIATTVLVSKDGILYIERAQMLSNRTADTSRIHAPGYAYLIVAAHKIAGLFVEDSSSPGWIYSAQVVTLLCRVLGLVPLYFIGKLLVGGRKSFYAMLILILLPHPVKMACELTREWPYMLFLATGFLFLLLGAKRGIWWAFGLVGLSAGLGYWIRPVCGQLVLYGFAWLLLALIRPRMGKMQRSGVLAAAAAMLVSFAVPVLPYMKYTGSLISPNATKLFQEISLESAPNRTGALAVNDDTLCRYSASVISRTSVKALGEVFRTIGENLMWFFFPPLLAGLCYRLRYEAEYEEIFFMTAFILINVAMMIFRYCYVEVHISNRWSLPLVAFTTFYIWDGLQFIDRRLSRKGVFKPAKGKKSHLPSILFVIGIMICTPKLLRPVGDDKRGFQKAIKWLRNNSEQQDVIAVPDKRLSFYAGRKGVSYREEIPDEADYLVTIVKDGDGEPRTERPVRMETSMWVDEKRKAKRIVIWRVL